VTFRPQLCVVTELAPFGSLSDMLLRTAYTLDAETLLRILQQIGEARISPLCHSSFHRLW
jgi:hypothetical protein